MGKGRSENFANSSFFKKITKYSANGVLTLYLSPGSHKIVKNCLAKPFGAQIMTFIFSPYFEV